MKAERHVKGCKRSSAQPWLKDVMCKVGPSPKHGLGVFATKDIKPFTLITLYPADGAKVWPNPDLDDAYVLWEFEGMTRDVRRVYSSSVPPLLGCELEIVGDPSAIKDPIFVGHMCNDACKMTKPEQAEIYEKMTLKGLNAQIGMVPWEANSDESLFEAMGIWCRRPIKAGEEIFVTYGAKYWLALMELQSVDLQTMD